MQCHFGPYQMAKKPKTIQSRNLRHLKGRKSRLSTHLKAFIRCRQPLSRRQKNGIDFCRKRAKSHKKRISVFSQVSFCFVCRRLGLTFFRKPQWQVNESLPRSEIQILLRVHSVGAKDGDKNTLKITSMWVYSMYVTLHVPKLLYCILYAHCIFPFGNIFFLV